jgi:F-type H+-transporting ATPase subunit gamma
MPSLKSLKIRISSVQSTRKITKAMQLVAASRLRHAKDSVAGARIYATKMQEIFHTLAASITPSEWPEFITSHVTPDRVSDFCSKAHLVVLITSERGLCGGLNSATTKSTIETIRNHQSAGSDIKILTVGCKGLEHLKREHKNLLFDHVDLSGIKSICITQAFEIASKIMNLYREGIFGTCSLHYGRFRTVLEQISTTDQIFPVILPEDLSAILRGTTSSDTASSNSVFFSEPNGAVALEEMLFDYCVSRIFLGLTEHAASEQGARMTAMDAATRNAGDMIDKLTLVYNRQRQTNITGELIEIISGAEAL